VILSCDKPRNCRQYSNKATGWMTRVQFLIETDIFLFSEHGDLLGDATYFLPKQCCKHFHWR